MATIDVIDASGATVPVEKPLAPGRSAAAASRPVALSTEDLAVLSSIDTKLTTLGGYVDTLEALNTTLNGYVDGLEGLIGTTNTTLTTLGGYVDGLEALNGAVTETAPASDTASSGLNGRLQRLAQRLTSLIALIPASLGQKAMSASLAVTVASDQSAFPISPGASAATGGIASTSRILSAAASTNGTSAKASAGRLYAIQGYNASASVRYLKLYNKASVPTVGTDTPVKTLALPPGSGFAFDWPHGYSLATGIAYALTTGSADSDTGALTAADVVGLNVDYV